MESFKKQSADADIAAEGVMGLYDGNPSTAVSPLPDSPSHLLLMLMAWLRRGSGSWIRFWIAERIVEVRNPKSKIHNWGNL